MGDGVGRALWKIYEEAVQNMPGEQENGVAGATLNFIGAFEQELSNADLELHCQAALERQSDKVAEVRCIQSRES